MQTPSGPTANSRPKRSILDWVEHFGNKLPEPAIIFVILACIVIAVAAIGSAAGWKVQPVQPRPVMVEKVGDDGKVVLEADGKPHMVVKYGPDNKPVTELKEIGKPIEPRSLLTSEGLYWMLSSMIRNFVTLPALGLVFVAMLGIGLAEKFGFFSALMRSLAFITPKRLLTPAVVLIGANSSVASDAGYIILPPLAAALYHAVGRHPVAGLAAAFAGVAGGFGGGFFPSGGDGAITGFAQDAARVVDPTYTVQYVHNLYFKMGSAIVVMFAGWFVTDKIVEPRLLRARAEAEKKARLESAAAKAAAQSGRSAGPAGNEAGDDREVFDETVIASMSLQPREKRGLILALLSLVAVLGVFAVAVFVPGMPLHGTGVPRLANDRLPANVPVTVIDDTAMRETPAEKLLWRPSVRRDGDGNVLPADFALASAGKPSLTETPNHRWSQVLVPLILFAFLIPGMVYGWCTGTLRSQKDFVDGLFHGIRSIVPVLVLAFFLGQFVNYFAYTRLDTMLAYAGGSVLVRADLPVPILIILFILLVVMGDFCLSGMLSKFGVLAPIFIPMFMFVGMSPELTTAAYRIGDSVVNIITPLNSYLLIILVVLQKYKKNAGLGSLISLMLPYSVVFFVIWTAFLLGWYFLGADLGPDSPLHFVPEH